MNAEEIKIVIGAGEYNNNPGWLHTQETELDLLDDTEWKKKFTAESITAILAEHVWEHLSYEEGMTAAKICYRYLKLGGYIRCAVPDGFFKDKDYQHIVQVGGPGPEDHPASGHKIVHTYKTLTNMFIEAGFTISKLEYCDEEGHFHTLDWSGEDGVIFRSKKYDPRNQGEKLVFPSLIVDAVKL
jgi:predicted SAM-dependent methyltransferase